MYDCIYTRYLKQSNSKTQSTKAVTRGWVGKVGNCSLGVEFQSCRMGASSGESVVQQCVCGWQYCTVHSEIVVRVNFMLIFLKELARLKKLHEEKLQFARKHLQKLTFLKSFFAALSLPPSCPLSLSPHSSFYFMVTAKFIACLPHTRPITHITTAWQRPE